jgi:glycerol-1-phosphate dehydrogenase [NAD(P)+]
MRDVAAGAADRLVPVPTPASPDRVAAAAAVPIATGPGVVPAMLAALDGRWLLVTQAEPLALLDPALVAHAARIETVTSLARADLEALVARTPRDVTAVVGLGGGMALDAAKWAAWSGSLPLILAPSIVSVDACVTNTVAVRDGGSIVYEGFVVADRVVVDTDVVARAPVRLNRAGVGDLLSIHTGLWDWRLGARAGRIAYDAGIAAAAANVLDRTEVLAPEIAAVSEAGVGGLVTMYAEVNALCLRAGHSGPEEGSEHYLGYRLEEVTGRSFVHGELIGLGTVLMSTLQGNDPARVVRILDTCGVAWRPADQELDRAVLVTAIAGLPAFVRAHRLPWSVADEADLSPAAAARLLDSILEQEIGASR